MRTVIEVRASKENQEIYHLGEQLEEKGYKVKYLLKDQEDKNSNVLVVVIDQNFNFFEACSYLLKIKNSTHKLIWVISDNNESEKERYMLYHLGACVYLKKAEEYNELVYSIENTLETINKKKYLPILDETKRTLTINEEENDLTPKEYMLLSKLYMHVGEVVTYETITALLWKKRYTEIHTVRIANIIHNLRLKIKPESKLVIKTVRNKGYMLVKTE